MKVQIRRGVFETNSSSTHSVSFKKGEMQPSGSLPVLSDNKVHAELGQFGWEEWEYTDSMTKLSYALTMVAETEVYKYIDKVDSWGNTYHCKSQLTVHNNEEFYETEGFKIINDAVASHCNCDGVELDTKITYHEYDNGTKYLDCDDWWIDHQSYESYSCLKDFLDRYNIDIERFIFDSSVVLITDNDNH